MQYVIMAFFIDKSDIEKYVFYGLLSHKFSVLWFADWSINGNQVNSVVDYKACHAHIRLL